MKNRRRPILLALALIFVTFLIIARTAHNYYGGYSLIHILRKCDNGLSTGMDSKMNLSENCDYYSLLFASLEKWLFCEFESEISNYDINLAEIESKSLKIMDDYNKINKDNRASIVSGEEIQITKNDKTTTIDTNKEQDIVFENNGKWRILFFHIGNFNYYYFFNSGDALRITIIEKNYNGYVLVSENYNILCARTFKQKEKQYLVSLDESFSPYRFLYYDIDNVMSIIQK